MRIIFFIGILFFLSNNHLLSMYGRMTRPLPSRNQQKLIINQINGAIHKKDFIKAQGLFMQIVNNTLSQEEKVYLGAIFDGLRKNFVDCGLYVRFLLKEKELLITDNKKIKDQLEREIVVLKANCKADNTQELQQRIVGADKNYSQEKKVISAINISDKDDSVFNNFKTRITKEFGEKVFKKIDKDKAITIADLDPKARFIQTIGFFDSDSGLFMQNKKEDASKSPEEELLAMRMGYSKLLKEYEECKKENADKTDLEISGGQEEQLKLIKAENKQLKKKNQELMVVKGSSDSEKDDKIISLQADLEKTKALLVNAQKDVSESGSKISMEKNTMNEDLRAAKELLAQVQKDFENCQKDLKTQIQLVESKQKEIDALWERIQNGEFSSIYGPSGI